MVTDQLIQYDEQLLSMATGEVARIFDVDDLRLADSRIYTRKGTRIAALNLADARELWGTQVPQANGIEVAEGRLLVLMQGGKAVRCDPGSGTPQGTVTTGLTNSGNDDFRMMMKALGEHIYFWNPKSKYYGDKKLVAVAPDSLKVEWRAVCDGVAGWDLINDADGNLLFCAGSKMHRLDPSTGKPVGKAIQLGGAWGIPAKCYEDGDVVVGCQKGYNDPELKCFNAAGRQRWVLPLAHRVGRDGRDAAFLEDWVILVFGGCDPSETEAWLIDRKTGQVARRVKQENTNLGCWTSVAALNEKHLLLSCWAGLELYQGIPSTWNKG
jgi:outer membrane protein assembly factor BamB